MGFFSDVVARIRGVGQSGLSEVKPVDWVVVGLGNPGVRYASTRHNVGYMVVDELLEPVELRPLRGFKASGAVMEIGGCRVLVVRSSTFMNTSGETVGPIAQAYGVSPDHVVVVHDELDLPAHKVRVKVGGNENGHNGLKSVSQWLGTRDYVRIRVGIGRPPRGETVPDYVLGALDSGEVLDAAVRCGADAVRLVVERGVSVAQNKIHRR
ncbi:aminoacyl-tRNA hydrolase [Corynebacterium rouxii]|uniref:Peptidyl-tRNA hydrolase n=1 Tax=Corynebacterium rouxii TaxID=2719119 RepID=A0ABU3PMW5_9CORY|nr:aminoacyl-tRNA hydrolase [Corynebacterium rouxii]MDT9408513.1 aminoacyl-tRNA hydrolase [Corynebacterium rouxii]MDT9410693.1 aminoacyl-tRNA hydrolase [Corynebacterium rouxii]